MPAELAEILVELPAISAELPGLSFGSKHAQPMKTLFRQNWRLSGIFSVFGGNVEFGDSCAEI